MFGSFDALWAHMGETMTQESVDNLSTEAQDELIAQIDNVEGQCEFLSQFGRDSEIAELIQANVYDAEERVELCEKYGLPRLAEDEDWGGDWSDADDARLSYEQGLGLASLAY